MAEYESAASAAKKLEDSGVLGQAWPEFAEPQASPEGTSTPEPEAEQAEEQSPDLQAEGESEDETVDEAAAAEDEAPEEVAQEADGTEAEYVLDEPLSIEEFAEAFGVNDPEKVMLKTNVGGDKGEISLKDALRSYQVEAQQTKKAQRFAAEEKQRIDAWNARQQEMSTHLASAAAIVDNLRKSVAAKYEDTEMARLKEEDPAQYAVKQLEKTNVLKDLDGTLAQVHAYAQHMQQQQALIMQQQIEETRKKILGTGPGDNEALIPEWNDQETYLRESNDIRSYMLGLGYAEEHTQTFADPRFVQLVRDASRYHKLKDQTSVQKEVAKKKVVKLPKARIARAGAVKQTSQTVAQRRKKAVERVRKSGKARDAAAVLEDVLPDSFFTD